MLRIELNDDVKKVSITGKNGEEKVVMRQELNEDDLDQIAGGYTNFGGGRDTPCVNDRCSGIYHCAKTSREP